MNKFDKIYNQILTFSCTHNPAIHKDANKFLDAIVKKYKPDLIVHCGDEVDNHAISYHDTDPNLESAGNELDSAIKSLKPQYEIFKKIPVLVCESNHGSLSKRKAITYGLPEKLFTKWSTVLEAPKNWEWDYDWTINTPVDYYYFCHGKVKAKLKLSQSMGMSAVQGHYHSDFYVNGWANPLGIHFDVKVGCLADKDHLAMAYGKNCKDRPFLGVVLIQDGIPKLKPMILNRGGKWRGKL